MGLVLKLVISVPMTILMIVAWVTFDQWKNRLPKRWWLYVFVILVLSRIAVNYIGYEIAGIDPRINIQVYLDNAAHMQQGLMPIRDFGNYFDTPYTPLFYYYFAFATQVMHVALILSGFEVLAFAVFFFIVRRLLSEDDQKLFAAIYLLSPLALWWAGPGGQTQSIFPFFYGIALYGALFIKNKGAASLFGGFFSGIAFFSSKITALFPLWVLIGTAPKRPRAFIGLLISVLMISPLILTMGPNVVFYPLEWGSVQHQPPSMWVTLNFFTGGLVPRTSSLYALATPFILWGVSLYLWYRFDRSGAKTTTLLQFQRFIAGWIIVLALFCLLISYGRDTYLMHWLVALFILLVMTRDKYLAIVVFFLNMTSNVHSSIYYLGSYVDIYDANVTLYDAVNLLWDVLLLGSYVFCVIFAYRWIMGLNRVAAVQSPVSTIDSSNAAPMPG